MQSDPHRDTEERKNIFKELESVQTEQDLVNLTEKYYPGWLICSLADYSSDYPHLRKNWETVCGKIGVQPQKIVLVEHPGFDPEHIIVQGICEYMMRKGYIVRRVGEFIACSECEKAIPCKDVWQYMKSKNLPVPREWKNRCSGCS